ncbi:hypothetical protein HYV89_04195 [Candidatus Woesearchaeota archaeon]|nr:hypothetical protein [Candidatus Woesearchaeota archaeon]
MKKIFFAMVFLIFIMKASAQVEVSENAALENDVGITPDSNFYGLENAMKRIRLAFTFGDEAKARKELEFAQERLKEVKLMIEKNKIEAAGKAEAKHKEIIARLKAKVEMDVEGNDEEVELQSEIVSSIEEQEIEIEDIKARIQVKGELSDNQRQLLNQLVESLKADNKEIRLRIDAREDKLKARLQAKGINEEEIKARLEEKKEIGLDRALRERIENVKRQIEKSEEYLNKKDATEAEKLKADLQIAREKLGLAEDELKIGNYEEAKKLILESLKLAVLIRGDDKFKEERDKLKERKVSEELRKEKLENAREIVKERSERIKEVREEIKESRGKKIESYDEDDDKDEIEDDDEDDLEERKENKI